MVKITVDISEDLHELLKKSAENNLRSMKNELKMIIRKFAEKEQNKHELCTFDAPKINKEKNLFDVETAFMPKPNNY